MVGKKTDPINPPQQAAKRKDHYDRERCRETYRVLDVYQVSKGIQLKLKDPQGHFCFKTVPFKNYAQIRDRAGIMHNVSKGGNPHRWRFRKEFAKFQDMARKKSHHSNWDHEAEGIYDLHIPLLMRYVAEVGLRAGDRVSLDRESSVVTEKHPLSVQHTDFTFRCLFVRTFHVFIHCVQFSITVGTKSSAMTTPVYFSHTSLKELYEYCKNAADYVFYYLPHRKIPHPASWYNVATFIDGFMGVHTKVKKQPARTKMHFVPVVISKDSVVPGQKTFEKSAGYMFKFVRCLLAIHFYTRCPISVLWGSKSSGVAFEYLKMGICAKHNIIVSQVMPPVYKGAEKPFMRCLHKGQKSFIIRNKSICEFDFKGFFPAT